MECTNRELRIARMVLCDQQSSISEACREFNLSRTRVKQIVEKIKRMIFEMVKYNDPSRLLNIESFPPFCEENFKKIKLFYMKKPLTNRAIICLVADGYKSKEAVFDAIRNSVDLTKIPNLGQITLRQICTWAKDPESPDFIRMRLGLV